MSNSIDISTFKLVSELYHKNDNKTQVLIKETLNKDFSRSEKSGFVYGFTLETDNNKKKDTWIKLGRTERNSDDRVKEWGGVLSFSLETPCNRRLERIIHLLFNYAHRYRPEIDRMKEKEWFHIEEKLNVSKYVSEIREFVSDYYENRLPILIDDKKSPINIGTKKLSININTKININTATKKELMLLPGIAKTLSDNIINYRSKATFTSINDIMRVSCIKNSKFEIIKNYICV